MTDGIYALQPAEDIKRKPTQIWLSPECADIVHRWMSGRDKMSRTAAVDQLIRLGAAESALRSMKGRKRG